MFEAANKMNAQGGDTVRPPQVVVPMQTVEKTADKKSTSRNMFVLEQVKQAEKKATEEKKAEKKQTDENRKVTEEMLSELEQDIEVMHNIGLKFSKHDDTGRTIVKVMDKENDNLIREIPAEDVLNLAAKLEEMIGILFDKEV
jgi:flagellar protein FlaG